MDFPTIPIALVDDHNLFRTVLADMLDGTTEFKVVLQASHGGEYVRAVKSGTEVAVAVVDLNMPVMDGFDTMAWIRANAPGTRSLALTYELTEDAMARAFQAGACGFLRKDTSKLQFLDALRQVATLGRYHAPSNGTAPHTGSVDHERRIGEALERLTVRELEFIKLICREEEFTNDQIAELMQVHRRTVDGYRETVYSKCGVKTKAGLVVFAYKWGLMS